MSKRDTAIRKSLADWRTAVQEARVLRFVGTARFTCYPTVEDRVAAEVEAGEAGVPVEVVHLRGE